MMQMVNVLIDWIIIDQLSVLFKHDTIYLKNTFSRMYIYSLANIVQVDNIIMNNSLCVHGTSVTCNLL